MTVEAHSRSRIGWGTAVAVAVVVGLAWAVPLFFLAYLWFLTLPLWLLVTAGVAIGLLVAGTRSPAVRTYGIGVALSIPVTIAALVAGIAYAAA
jgi:hypothetical protein